MEQMCSAVWLSCCLHRILLFLLLQFGRDPEQGGDSQEQTRELAKRMGNLTILRKGKIDIISDGDKGIC